ncbi:hypothetical protein [Sphingomonas elodea]|uniref:hypothetical protein n=1 Tax=Sphingomonas elodea TaxID=179878 RepID=UPI0011106B7A|nr:hypothetical protein [Sphingomonas elodea]
MLAELANTFLVGRHSALAQPPHAHPHGHGLVRVEADASAVDRARGVEAQSRSLFDAADGVHVQNACIAQSINERADSIEGSFARICTRHFSISPVVVGSSTVAEGEGCESPSPKAAIA